MIHMNIDALDSRILAALQTDASISNQTLAQRVSVSPATALRRVRAMTDSGLIESTVAIVSPSAVGGVLTALCEVTLDVQNENAFDAFDQLIANVNEVTQCYRTSPGVDFSLVLTLRDMGNYQSVSQQLFIASNNVRNVRTRFVTKRSKFNTRIPLPETFS
jgi:Lrp/AsnC family transcriptional regulator, leucine-responsive regulatory protein